MDDPVTVGDVMDREYLGVSEGDPVSGAIEAIYEAGVEGAVVFRGREPVGVLRARDVMGLLARGGDPDATAVDEVMSGSLPAVDAGAPLLDATEVLAESDARRAVVEDGGEVVGVLSEHDLVTAHSVLSVKRGTVPSMPAEPPAPETDTATEADEEFEAQGVCEVCGSLARPLRYHNGRLVCSACIGA